MSKRMKSVYVRNIDDLGRLTIPMEWRKGREVSEGDPFDLLLCRNYIVAIPEAAPTSIVAAERKMAMLDAVSCFPKEYRTILFGLIDCIMDQETDSRNDS